jgi:hypothetical protein
MKNNDKAESAGGSSHVTINSFYSFFNHSYNPNMESVATKTGRVGLFATKDIAKGAKAFISYLSDLQKCGCTRCKAFT